MDREVHSTALARCQEVLPGWRNLSVDDIAFDAPKGFSSFTMGMRPHPEVDPPAVLYRQLDGKENAILDGPVEREVFMLLGERGIAPRTFHADESCRIEAFYDGRTLTRDDVFDAEIRAGIASELYRFHQLRPPGLPDQPFFELLHRKWAHIGRPVLTEHRHLLPENEQAMCDDLLDVYAESTIEKVRRHVPDGPTVFCHNDTYHGNVMQLADGAIKLLDFEFSCLGHPAFDFANLFAETVMRHGFAEPPHFSIAEPTYDEADIIHLVECYLAHDDTLDADERAATTVELVTATTRLIPVSHFMYAMAAIPLALNPIQKIRFVPYALERFRRFLAAPVDDR